MNSLEQLAAKYNTDKLTHGYIPFYEKHLPPNPMRLLEIGVLDGASIRMWQKRFPQTEIHGLDLFQANPIPNIPGVVWHTGNQCDHLLLDKLRSLNFDIIIDDGSHNSRDQMITFFGLFNGKQYYIEDLHCCRDEFWRQGLPYEATALKLFSAFMPGISTTTVGNIILIESI